MDTDEGVPRQRIREIYLKNAEKCYNSLDYAVTKFTTFSNLYSKKFYSIPLKWATDLRDKCSVLIRYLEKDDFNVFTLYLFQRIISDIHTKKFMRLAEIAIVELLPKGFTSDALMYIFEYWTIVDQDQTGNNSPECEWEDLDFKSPVDIHEQFIEIFNVPPIKIVNQDGEDPESESDSEQESPTVAAPVMMAANQAGENQELERESSGHSELDWIHFSNSSASVASHQDQQTPRSISPESTISSLADLPYEDYLSYDKGEYEEFEFKILNSQGTSMDD